VMVHKSVGGSVCAGGHADSSPEMVDSTQTPAQPRHPRVTNPHESGICKRVVELSAASRGFRQPSRVRQPSRGSRQGESGIRQGEVGIRQGDRDFTRGLSGIRQRGRAGVESACSGHHTRNSVRAELRPRAPSCPAHEWPLITRSTSATDPHLDRAPLGLPDNGRRGYACAGEVLDDTGHQLRGSVLAPLRSAAADAPSPVAGVGRGGVPCSEHAPRPPAPETPLVAVSRRRPNAQSFGSRRPATPRVGIRKPSACRTTWAFVVERRTGDQRGFWGAVAAARCSGAWNTSTADARHRRRRGPPRRCGSGAST